MQSSAELRVLPLASSHWPGIKRIYQQGIDGGKVRLNGAPARASSEIREGDSLSADGLGRIDFKRVVNETRRGNYKVELDVHK